jgi:YYY domain-containing protein
LPNGDLLKLEAEDFMSDFFDWLGREGGAVLSWWLLATLAGLAAWPLTFRLLRGLRDKGYALTRSIGLLLTAFLFWLATSLGLLTNSNGSVILAGLVVLAVGLVLHLRGHESMRQWMRAHWKYILVVEILFLSLFLMMVLYRAHFPDTRSTEKGMDIAFLSAIQRSETFPPNDPWMSGFAISYYYFGYLMAAVLGNLSGVSSGTAFSLMLALLFALAGVGTFGVTYSLVRARASAHRRKKIGQLTSRRVAAAVALLAVIFVIVLGNLQAPLIEVPYETRTASAGYLSFWDQDQRDVPRVTPAPTSLDRWEGWWWFRAARVIRDRDLGGTPIGASPIDEFPAFSFVLGDMHPHVLSLPFAVLAIGLALHVLLFDHDPDREQVILYGICIGALVFLNTWDGPIYLALLVGADAVRRLLRNENGRLSREDWIAMLRLGGAVLVLALVLYAPFLISFRSQLGGVLPNVIFPTGLQQFFIMFGPFILILLFFLGVEWWRGQDEMNWGMAFSTTGIVLLIVVLAMVVLGVIAWLSPGIRQAVYQILEAAGGLLAQIGPVLRTRLVGLPLVLLLGGMIMIVIARLFSVPRDVDDEPSFPASTGFALLLVGLGAVLALVPDFLYLRDNFMVRMNTVFKLYYQVWVVWAIASAYAVYTILVDVDWSLRPSGVVRTVFAGVLVVVVMAGMVYPVLAFYTRAFVESGRNAGTASALTLDGALSTTGMRQDDYAVIQCLNALVQGDGSVIVEAVGPPYRPEEGGRVAALTGIPTVINWEGHQSQWRGATYLETAGTRAQDVARLYNDPNWIAVRPIIDQYGIDYIYVGTAELTTYDPFGLSKFAEVLTPVCQSGDVVAYRIDS